MITFRLLMAPLCATALTLAACGSGTPATGDGGSAASATPTAAAADPTTTSPSRRSPTTASTGSTQRSYRAQIMAWGRELATCARRRGFTNFPDPVWPANSDPADGDDSWGLGLFSTSGGKEDLAAALSVCKDVLRRMPPNTDVRPPSATTLNHMKQFAACLREHGLTDFPDPHSDGRFPIIGGRYEAVMSAAGLKGRLRTAFDACGRYQVEWRMRATR
jgi:hypothetical protein